MYQTHKLQNGLTLVTIDLPYLDSVTSLVAVAAGSRYETREINGISHFLEHMFFKGSKKYPSAEQIASIVDGIGAVNNAATSKEYTFYWIKSAARHIELATDMLSSMLKESLLQAEEIEREKGVIIEELRMYRDNPTRYVWDLYEQLQFGDQPIGWDIGGDEQTINSLNRDNFVKYVDSLYSPENMVLVYAGKIPANIKEIATQHFNDLPKRSHFDYLKFESLPEQKVPKVNIFHKKTDQANLVLGVEGFDRNHQLRHAARVLGLVLGEGMSSRLFLQVRERRGLAYHVSAGPDYYLDTGSFTAYSGLKLEKVEEGLKVIRDEMEKMITEKVSDEELKKAKDMERGRLALRSESTNFLAEHFGVKYILDGELESFDDYLSKIDQVTAEDVQTVAKQLFKPERYNLQIIAPLDDPTPFTKILTD